MTINDILKLDISCVEKVQQIARLDRKLIRLLACKITEWFDGHLNKDKSCLMLLKLVAR